MSAFGGPNIIDDGLVLYLDAGNRKSYPGSGTTWFDKSGRGNNGTLTNGPTFNTGSLGSIVFDGSNDYINIPDLSFTAGAPFHISSWVYFSPGSGTYPMIAQSSNLSLLFGIQIGTSTYTGFNLYLGSNSFQTTVVGRPAVNQWYNVVGNYDGSRARIYINGILSSISTNSGITSALSGFTLGNGSAGGNSYWKGNIANTQIYNRALSAQEIAQNYNATKGRFGL